MPGPELPSLSPHAVLFQSPHLSLCRQVLTTLPPPSISITAKTLPSPPSLLIWSSAWASSQLFRFHAVPPSQLVSSRLPSHFHPPISLQCLCPDWCSYFHGSAYALGSPTMLLSPFLKYSVPLPPAFLHCSCFNMNPQHLVFCETLHHPLLVLMVLAATMLNMGLCA